MSVAPITITFQPSGSTLNLSRSGDIVSVEYILRGPMTYREAKPIPAGYELAGSLLILNLTATAQIHIDPQNMLGTGPGFNIFNVVTATASGVVTYLAIHDASSVSALDGLLQNLPGFTILTDTMKQNALDSALIPDSMGLWPAEPGYTPTYDIYYAAITLVSFLRAQPVVRQSSSEGTSVAVDAPDWDGILAYFRGQSVIIQSQGGSALTKVLIPDGPHVTRTDMRGRSGYYADVDTDLD